MSMLRLAVDKSSAVFYQNSKVSGRANRLRAQGKKPNDIAQALGISRASVFRVLSDAGSAGSGSGGSGSGTPLAGEGQVRLVQTWQPMPGSLNIIGAYLEPPTSIGYRFKVRPSQRKGADIRA